MIRTERYGPIGSDADKQIEADRQTEIRENGEIVQGASFSGVVLSTKFSHWGMRNFVKLSPRWPCLTMLNGSLVDARLLQIPHDI